jgi:hypothetical protein
LALWHGIDHNLIQNLIEFIGFRRANINYFEFQIFKAKKTNEENTNLQKQSSNATRKATNHPVDLPSIRSGFQIEVE